MRSLVRYGLIWLGIGVAVFLGALVFSGGFGPCGPAHPSALYALFGGMAFIALGALASICGLIAVFVEKLSRRSPDSLVE